MGHGLSGSAADLVFLTRGGRPWGDQVNSFPLSEQFKKLQIEVGIYRKGRGFYGLRHSFETIGGDKVDQVAVDIIMGHTDPSRAAVYRDRVDDARLVAVTDHVRQWLFGSDA